MHRQTSQLNAGILPVGGCCPSHFDCLKRYPCWAHQPHIGWLDISQGAAANLQDGVLPPLWKERWYKYTRLMLWVSVSHSHGQGTLQHSNRPSGCFSFLFWQCYCPFFFKILTSHKSAQLACWHWCVCLKTKTLGDGINKACCYKKVRL